jgi:hypothetical protein
LCGEQCLNDSLPMPVYSRFDSGQCDYCSPCVSGALWGSGDNLASEEWIFRAKPATHSARRRPPIPSQGGHPFRSEGGHFSGLRRNQWPASPGIGGRLPL